MLLKIVGFGPILSFLLTSSLVATVPNIVVLLTDDQGYGDLGYTGNPDINTPTIDAFAKESVVFENFYVSPVCTPTRASLLTGRYNYRTGATDTWMGRSTMHQDELTLAEALKVAGYATGLFGKWHLGDTYPYRPQDQGFDSVLMHLGGGIGQPSGPAGNAYFDPILWENGQEKTLRGY
ncbi:MAG: sulfatase-like hydrolase/transferase, partial [Verrucomicrobiota bacterium]